MTQWGKVEPAVVGLPGDPRLRAWRAQPEETLTRWSMPAALDPVLLVASELVSNAVRYGEPPLRLLVRRLVS